MRYGLSLRWLFSEKDDEKYCGINLHAEGRFASMSIDKLLRKAIEKHDNREYEEAGALYRKILSTKPRNIDANYLLGTLYAECEDYEKAKPYLIKADQMAPNSPMILVNLGNVYRKLKTPSLAVKCFTRARQLMPNLFQAHLGLGSTLLDMDEDLDRAAECFQTARSLAPQVPEIYHQIGMLSLKRGDLPDALQLLETARSMNPHIPDIDFDLGLICLKGGENEKAADYFREACRLSPTNIKSAYFLAIATGDVPADDLLQKYSALEFDDYAATFEQRLVDKLHYTLPFRVAETLQRVCGDACRFESVADLGCGTGLTGEAIRSVTGRLTGIDISENMIEFARAKNCFDQLYCGDVVATLNAQADQFDLFVATDVLVYIGNMEALMSAILAHATPGALFLFSTEKLAGEGLLLQATGRYAHSASYVHDVMMAHNCSVISEEVIDLRLETGSWLKGDLFVVRLPA